IAGSSVFFLLQWKAKKLPENEQAILRNEIFVARASVKEPIEDLKPIVNEEVQKRLKQNSMTTLDAQLLRKQIEEQIKAAQQVVQPDYMRRWIIDLGAVKNSLRNRPLFLRVKFHAAETRPDATYVAQWQIGPPESAKIARQEMSLAADTFHEFPIPPNLFDDSGKLTIEFSNRNPTALLFPLDEGMEVLYREGGFGLNFARGLGIILCWLALLAAVGLAAASFLSFPVAAFFSIAVLLIGLSSGTLSSVVEEGSIMGTNRESSAAHTGWIDAVMVPIFRGVLKVVNLVQGFSPIDSLSTGRSITWTQLSLAIGQIVLLLGGIFAVIGIILFSRRELARVQTQ
ncbi:MAG: hypothetical protein M3Y82_08265, partial [Verrucomicrobiota bacterium]|nr:hypothetical protein [Verrucomicrobiota bacterium]